MFHPSRSDYGVDCCKKTPALASINSPLFSFAQIMMAMTTTSGGGCRCGRGRGGCGRIVGGAKAAIEGVFSLPLILAERVPKAVAEAESFKIECAEVGKQAVFVAARIRSAACVVAALSSPFYDRPLHRVLAEASKSPERALGLVRRCRRAGFLCSVFTITTGSTDFRKVIDLLNASATDLRWLLSIYSDEDGGGGAISLPPIASTDPILAWVWSYTATVQSSARSPTDRAQAAQALASLALDNDRNKKIILEEGGAPPLLTLLRDGPSGESQIAAAMALYNLASAVDNVSLILQSLGVTIVVHVLSNSPMRLQIVVARLVSLLAAQNSDAREELARENAVRAIVSLLSFEVPFEELRPAPKKHSSIHSLVRGIEASSLSNFPLSANSIGGGSSSSKSTSLLRDYYHHHDKDRENESLEVKLELKTACAEALWMLAKDCLSSCRKITETKGLLCLSKIIELAKGDLQHYCMMTVVEIALQAENDADLRRSAFKVNSPAAKSVVELLIRVAQVGRNITLQIAAIKAIGCLARTFPAKETKVLMPLVLQLGHWNPEVADEAARALGKFASPDNFLCYEHSKTIIEFAAVPSLMRLYRAGEKAQLPAVVLLSYLALHHPKSEALERAKVLQALQSVIRSPMAQHPSLRELLPQATYQLEVYQIGMHAHEQSFEV